VCRLRRRTNESVKNEKTITFRQILETIWEVNKSIWRKFCDHYDVHLDNVARDHLYRTKRTCCYSEPQEIWGDVDPEAESLWDKKFDRESSIKSVEHYAFQFL
jgi:hypothetical protein